MSLSNCQSTGCELDTIPIPASSVEVGSSLDIPIQTWTGTVPVPLIAASDYYVDYNLVIGDNARQ